MRSAIDASNTKAGTSVLGNSQNLSRQTMSTREVAQLTGKSHDNVLRDARRLLEEGVLKSEETRYRHPQNGQSYPEFLLSQRDTLVLVSGYSSHLRAKIIDRWQELETRVVANVQIPQTFAEALRLAADQAEQNLQLQHVIQKQAPKVAANGRLAAAGGAISMISRILSFQLVTGVIVALQVFVQPLLLTNSAGISQAGGVPDSTTLYMVQVYQEFFLSGRFGYGSAMLWVFFLIILGLTLVLLRSSKSWVYYEVDTDAEREGAVR